MLLIQVALRYELVIAYLLKGSEMTEEQQGQLHILADVGQTCGRGKIVVFGDLPAVACSSRWFSFKLRRRGDLGVGLPIRKVASIS